MRFNGTMPDAEPPAPRPSEEPPSLSLTLQPIKRWPDACRPERECEIEGTVYPAPDALDRSTVPWWLDFVQIRINAARGYLNNILAAAIGALFATVVALITGLIASGTSWATAATAPLAIFFVTGLTWYMLRGASHHALEQRWLLYRERARRLGLTP